MRLSRHVPLLGLVVALALLWAGALAVAAPTFPALTGRVVDGAGILPGDARSGLETKLKELEDKSGIQLVVATLPSLQGYEIEPFANGLFRAWKLGEAKANNGVLLLVAPNEKRVRIEVGYGLEGTLTDALSKIIIANAMAPRFKANDFPGGITRGVDDIITVLTTDAAEWQKRPSLRPEEPALLDQIMPFLVLLLFAFVIWTMIRNARGQNSRLRGGRGAGPIFLPGPGSWGSGSGWGGGGGGWSGGGGFSGGGGSSGGGGASGGW
ncbi:MAG: hypothetical protein JWN07_2191 [Hyphomicrobiales bacterium]|nr:hypothetical protein [Hyphomicrobiales bacterium]